MVVLLILLYILGMFTTFYLMNETTKHTMFNKIWFAIFWPTVSIMCIVEIFKNIKSK